MGNGDLQKLPFDQTVVGGGGERMCKYCNDENEKKIIEKPINLGVLGEYCIDTRVSESNLLMEFLRADECEELFFQTIKITYCPFCGRRLKK